MSESSSVRVFKIKVEAAKTEVAQTPDTGDTIPGCPLYLGPLRSKVIEFLIGLLRDNRLRGREEFQFLGENLFAVLFMQDNKGQEELNAIGSALAAAVMDHKVPQLRVELEFAEDQSELASWPWEYLYCPSVPGRAGSDYFLADLARLSLTRTLRLNLPQRDLLLQDGELPLKVLLIAASPKDLEPVQYHDLLQTLETLEKEHGDRIQVFKLVPDDAEQPNWVTFARFADQVRVLEPHVIHFVGHARTSERRVAQLAFAQPDGQEEWISQPSFISTLREVFAIRLVFLQTCQSALHDAYRAISSIAKQLARENIPAVGAMQYQQEFASLFTKHFYTALMEAQTIDVAMHQGHTALRPRTPAEFAFPVLYVRQPQPLLKRAGAGAGLAPSAEPGQVQRAAVERASEGAPSAPTQADVGALLEKAEKAGLTMSELRRLLGSRP